MVTRIIAVALGLLVLMFVFKKHKGTKSDKEISQNTPQLKKTDLAFSYQRLEDWLDKVLCDTVPEEVVAFCFNLYEDGGNMWSLELIGASSFDKENDDWACDEVITTRECPLVWKNESTWETVMKEARKGIEQYLKKGKYAHVLKQKKCIALGFVDGDLLYL